ncbi:MAG: SPASM domain-containing protein [Desulfobacteraceae bacterium]|nr:SPASM domain-containing protein [Desulfobacteraceae bacterium]
MKRDAVGIGALLKCFGRLAPHPWIWTRLAGLQTEKWFLNAFGPGKDPSAGKIRQISFRVTDLCNLRCITCGQWGKTGFLHGRDLKPLKSNEVDPRRYVEILIDLFEHGHRPCVYLWGGEPMLYRGTLDLIDAAASMRLPVSIATNGSFVAPAASRLVRAPLFLLQVSIDGHCAEAHNAIRPGVGGADNFADIERALSAVRRERESARSGLPLIASLTVISRENAHRLTDIYRAFRDRVDLFVFYLSWWIDAPGAADHEEDFRRRFGSTPTLHRGWIADWKPIDHTALNAQIEALKAQSAHPGRPPVVLIPNITGEENLRSYYTDHRNRFGFDRCISIYQAVEVDSNGDLSPCRDYHDYVVGNIKDETVTRLWNSPAYRRFRRSITGEGPMPVCSRCCGMMGY